MSKILVLVVLLFSSVSCGGKNSGSIGNPTVPTPVVINITLFWSPGQFGPWSGVPSATLRLGESLFIQVEGIRDQFGNIDLTSDPKTQYGRTANAPFFTASTWSTCETPTGNTRCLRVTANSLGTGTLETKYDNFTDSMVITTIR